MSDSIRVHANQLREVFELLIKHVTEGSAAEVDIGKDYFWSIPSPECYEIYKEPSEFTVGQVSEAWANLQEMLEDESKVLSYGLVWLADVLRVIGDEALG